MENCNKLNIDASINNSTLISTSVLIPGDQEHAYLYTMSRKSNEVNQAFGCTLTKSDGSISLSNCSTNPFLSADQVGSLGSSTIYWGGHLLGGGNSFACLGDQYVIYYDSSVQHLIGTITTSLDNDFDLIGVNGYAAVGQEFYLTLGADYAIKQPEYLTYHASPGWRAYFIGSISQYSTILRDAVAGDVLGKTNGKIILDTFSIH